VNKLVSAIALLFISNIFAWWQLNAQFTNRFKGHWFWSSPEWMAIFGIPIGYLFFLATRLSYEYFGFTWNIRMIGFGIGTVVFGIMSYLFLREIPTVKTIICLLLALSIILIQVTNVIGE
jgi:hypothetical protein|tara:strand:+ start:205 stop:564 length:360 start_codon:yes stop_codon:yes gene_type:complete